MSRKNPHSGSDFDDFLKEEGILAEAEVRALKYVIALSLRDLMSRQKVTKSAMASRRYSLWRMREVRDRAFNASRRSLVRRNTTDVSRDCVGMYDFPYL